MNLFNNLFCVFTSKQIRFRTHTLVLDQSHVITWDSKKGGAHQTWFVVKIKQLHVQID